MSRANKPIDAKDDEHVPLRSNGGAERNACMHHRDEGDNQSHGKRMPYSNRRQGVPNRRTPLFLQPERHRKEPAHPGIYAMESAEPKQRQPRPRFAHG